MRKELDSRVLALVKKNFILMSIWAILKSTKEKLASKEKIYSPLNGTKTSEYEHVFNVWSNFEMNAMKEYRDLCWKCDVLLLLDVLEKFRNSLKKTVRVIILVQRVKVGMQCLMTKSELELTSDGDIYIFFEKGMRGGVSYIVVSLIISI